MMNFGMGGGFEGMANGFLQRMQGGQTAAPMMPTGLPPGGQGRTMAYGFRQPGIHAGAGRDPRYYAGGDMQAQAMQDQAKFSGMDLSQGAPSPKANFLDKLFADPKRMGLLGMGVQMLTGGQGGGQNIGGLLQMLQQMRGGK